MLESMHSFHPILVHFTIALLVTSAFLLLVGKVFINQPWAEKCRSAGGWNMVIGALSALPTIVAGFYAFATVDHDTASHLVMIEHRNFAIMTTVVWCILAVWRIWVLRQNRRSGWPFFTAVFFALCLLVYTGFKGGSLVFHHGLGVSSLPSSSGEGHDHEHSAGHGHEEAAGDGHDSDVIQAETPPAQGHDDSDGHAHDPAQEQPSEEEAPGDETQGHDNSDGHSHETKIE